jgi:hypothetical protein
MKKLAHLTTIHVRYLPAGRSVGMVRSEVCRYVLPTLALTIVHAVAWQVDLLCGLENELLTVTEPEKCEYLITGTTPALCSPLEFERDAKDEL